MPAPILGESLISWVATAADRFEIPARQAMEVLGVRVPGRSLSHLMVDMPEEGFRGFSAATGLGQENLRAMTLIDHGQLVAGEPDTDSSRSWHLRWARKAQLNHRHSNYCPRCLVENGHRWLVQWRLPWHFVCVEHGTFLVTRCPGCGGRQRWDIRPPHRYLCTNKDYMGYDGALVSSMMLPREGQLAAARATGCGAEFASAKAVAVSDPGLVELQTRIDDLARGAAAAGIGEPDPSPLTLLLYLAGMTAAAAAWRLVDSSDPEVMSAIDRYCESTNWRVDQGRLVEVSRLRGGLQLAAEPTLMAGALHVALRAVEFEDPVAGLEWFVSAALPVPDPQYLRPLRPGSYFPPSVELFKASARGPR